MNVACKPIARLVLLPRVTWVAIAVAIAEALAETCLVSAARAAELVAGSEIFAPPLEFEFGEVTLLTRGTFTYGTIICAQNRDPTLLPPELLPPWGSPARPWAARTSTAATSTTPAGDLVSTVLKAFVDVDAKYRTSGLFVSSKAWTDFALRNGDVPHGNVPNRYIENTPLSDDGFSRLGSFAGVQLIRAIVYGT